MSAAELSDLGQFGQGADVEDRDVRTVSTQDDRNSPVLHVGCDDGKAWIAADKLTQPSRHEIVEVGKDNGDGGPWWHRRTRSARARTCPSAQMSARVSLSSPLLP